MKNINKSVLVILLIPVIIVISLVILNNKTTSNSQNADPIKTAEDLSKQEAVQGSSSSSQPPMTIDKTKKYNATLNTTAGNIVISFDADKTPITVNNFVMLAQTNFYNGTIFHRTIKDFMIQGGDPKGDGTGGPGYKFNDEAFDGSYTRGTVAMANAGPNTNGSQFFIVQKDVDLPKNYVIFGHVTAGLDVVDAIANAPVEANGQGEVSKPVSPVKIESVQISEN